MSRNILPIFVALLLPSFVILTPVPQDSGAEALVITSTEISKENVQETSSAVPEVLLPPELKSMHVDCNVTNRYAHTVVSSRYKNPANVAQETTFSIILPDTAFISAFSMEIKDKIYHAYVKEKEEAKREYNKAVQSGLGAGYVEQNARDSNMFTVSVNVEPLSKVTFNLAYEELLARSHGKYEMVINLNPGQLVKDLTVDVHVNESQKLVNVKTPALRSGNEIIEDKDANNNEYATITPVGEDGKAVYIHFAPTIKQQKEMAKRLEASKKNDNQNEYPSNDEPKSVNKTYSLSGQFVIEYDVERNSKGGEVLVNNGYFVHFFAPPELKPLPKHAVFVLDVSGSMQGRKIDQLKVAMNAILDELKPNDYFNLVEFSSGAKVWNFDNTDSSPTFGPRSRYSWTAETTPTPSLELPPAYLATSENIQKAKDIVKNMRSWGGTNLNDALKIALNLTSIGIPSKDNLVNTPQPIVIFLTDGDATDGETDTKVILKSVDELNKDGKAAIFSLAFGYDANKDVLKKLSLKNNGFMRQIYEASDAALQLQDFYIQISSPLLANVTFTYPEGEVNSLTKNSFHTLFDGGEFVVSGKIDNIKDKILYVRGMSIDGPMDYPPVVIEVPDKRDVSQTVEPLERLWAYMTIKQLLDKKDELTGDDNKNSEVEDLNKQALKLALQYSFVTPITSLVVVKPNATDEATNAENVRQQEGTYNNFQALSLPPYEYQSTPYYGGGGGLSGGGGSRKSSRRRGGGAGGIYFARYPAAAPGPASVSADDFDSDALSEVITEYEESTTTYNELELQWLSALKPDPDHITIDNKNYLLGSNETVIDNIHCTVNYLQLNGTCTLLTACTKIYPKLDSYVTYYNNYFCKLEPDYAGVCCIDLDEAYLLEN